MSKFVLNKNGHQESGEKNKNFEIDLNNYTDRELREMEKFIKQIKLSKLQPENNNKGNSKKAKESKAIEEKKVTEIPEVKPQPKKLTFLEESDELSSSSSDESEAS